MWWAVLSGVVFTGWQWSPSDRPSFAEIHQAFETMFQESSISDGRSGTPWTDNSRDGKGANCILNCAFFMNCFAVKLNPRLYCLV